jgi:hypothetical protein
MASSSPAPDNDEWLVTLVRRSSLLTDATLQHHWQTIIPWLSTGARYKLAALLLETEHACTD